MENNAIQQLIEQLYTKRQYRPVVVGVVYDKQRHRVLIGRSAYDPDAWNFVQGGIKPGEQLEGRLARELYQEVVIDSCDLDQMTFLSYAQLDYPPKRSPKRRRGFSRGKAYFGVLVPYHGDGQLQLSPAELAEARWVTPEEAPQYFHQGRTEKAVFLEKFLKYVPSRINE